MYNLGDDSELDRISREAAGKYAPPGSPNWEAMHEELDKVLPEEKKRRFVFFWWLLPVLLIGGTAAYWLTAKNDKTTSSAVDVSTAPASPQTNAKQNEVTAGKNAPISTQKENTAVNENSSASINKQRATINTGNLAGRKFLQPAGNNPGGSFVTVGSDQKLRLADEAAKQTDLSKPEQKLQAESSGTTSVNPKNDKVEAVKEKAADATTNTNQSSLQTEIATKENKTQPVITTTDAPAEEIKPVADKSSNTHKKKGWSYAFLAGVDKSTVKFKYGNSPGINIGMMLGYHFNDKLSLHTGAIFTQKNYKLAGEDFTAPKGSTVSYYKLENVTGYCRMWEVPLLLRYTVSRSDKHNVFLSTGLSSYFMTRENYDYFYYFNGQPVTRNTAYNSKDTHVLSIVHLSAGFENSLGKDWSLQIEPYAKLPLGGVGFGNIQLSSFGVNFSFQHRQR